MATSMRASDSAPANDTKHRDEDVHDVPADEDDDAVMRSEWFRIAAD